MTACAAARSGVSSTRGGSTGVRPSRSTAWVSLTAGPVRRSPAVAPPHRRRPHRVNPIHCKLKSMPKTTKGRKRPEGAGRKKGTPNKITRTVREAFTEAFAAVNQGPSALAAWGKANPDKFYPLATKLIPQEVTGSVAVAAGVLAVPMPVDPAQWAALAAAQQAAARGT